MHAYLRAIGFSDEQITEHEMEVLLDTVYRNYDNMVSVIGRDTSTSFLEVSRSLGPGFGLRVCGEKDAHGFHRINYFPYLTGSGITSEENVAIQMRATGDSYAGVLEDGRVGTAIIFALQNPGDYRRELKLGRLGEGRITTTLSALSLSGLVLLPLQDAGEPEDQKIAYYENRTRTVAEAKAGSERAMELLTLQDMDLYAMLQRRALQEDILTIVESYFMPFGMESDQYRILGTIRNVRWESNRITGDDIAILTVQCNGMLFDVCINREDLGGEPAEGRRFKGTIWLQGRVNFAAMRTAEKESFTSLI